MSLRDPRFKKGNKYAWKPGQCGNPSGVGGGRPSKNLQKIAEEFGSEEHGRTGKDRDAHLIEVLYRQACQGKIRAAELYLAYRYGKPVQQQINVNADLTAEQKVSGMSEIELDARLAELLNAHQLKGRIQ